MSTNASEAKPEWLYPADRCCDAWTPEDGCTGADLGAVCWSYEDGWHDADDAIGGNR